MKQKGFTLIEMLVVIAIIGILASMLAGPLMNARVSALKTACISNLSQMGKALFQYESPSGNGVAPIGTGLTSNKSTALPIAAMFKAGLLDNSKIVLCPLGNVNLLADDATGSIVDESNETAGGITAMVNPVTAGASVSTTYLFTFYYTQSSAGSRVIAGDAGAAGVAYSPNHGDTADTDYMNGANALFKDGHVKPTTPNSTATKGYTVEGAQFKDTSEPSKVLWGTSGNATTAGMGTCIGAYGS